ncbi:MAG: 3-oxoacyl-ACP reductase FabG [Ignavibacteria bacterium]|jgi:3-oxoacyl-[acyl-carrier protein] reductase
MYDFKDKVVFITGGSRGIGRAMAVKFAELNAKVVITYKSRIDHRFFKPKNIHYFKCDSADAKRVKEVVQNVVKKFKKIDVLINNAGITKDTLIMRMSEKDWDSVIDTNLKGTFFFCKEVARNMVKNHKGKIINVSSIVGVNGNAGQSNYSASKAGQIGLTKTLAKELGSHNIQVNVVAPGFVETDMTSVLSDDVKKAILKTTKKKAAKPGKVADFVAFLASEDSDLINGQTFIVEAIQMRQEERLYF